MTYSTIAESIISEPNGTKIFTATEEIVRDTTNTLLGLSPSEQQITNRFLIRSQSDKFDYKLIKLDNGITVFLISDPSYKELKNHVAHEKDDSASSECDESSESSDGSENEDSDGEDSSTKHSSNVSL